MSDSKTAWQSIQPPPFPKVTRTMECDVLVVGGGLTGLTTAYLLSKAGKSVVLLERSRLSAGDTGCTTAHLTEVTDIRLSELLRKFGSEDAKRVWKGGRTAIDAIEQIAATEEIECEFQRVPGFLHAPLGTRRDDKRNLRADFDEAIRLGIAATFTNEVPGIGVPGICFANQAKFHPLKYVAGLAPAVERAGGRIFEKSAAAEFLDKPRAVVANGKRIRYGYVVIATHVPLEGKTGLVSAAAFQTKLAPYTSYAIGAHVPKDTFPEASFWDPSDPYYYLRIDRKPRRDFAIFGGEDHKTGQVADPVERWGRLEKVFAELCPGAKTVCRWSGQVIETHDGLPYIGETADKQFVATGFAGNGMTFGTLAALMARDAVLGRKNPWQGIFHPDRKALRGLWSYVAENLDYPYYLVRDRLASAAGDSTDEVPRGEGRVLKIDGRRVACSRDDKGQLTSVSAVCTHMGCIVHWNAAEGTWDCPCHGSRFQADGTVLAGPAEVSLEPVKIARTPGKNGASKKARENSSNGHSRKRQGRRVASIASAHR